MAWIIGHAHLITWTTEDFYYADVNDVVQPDTVKLEISHDGGANWDDIVASAPNTGSYSWIVTGPACADAIIRYSGVNNTEITADTIEFSIVAEVLTSITVSPNIAMVPPSAQRTFTAVGNDQNGDPMVVQPAFTWTVSGGGSIGAATGIFTAGATPSGPFTVTATSGAIDGTATVYVANPNGGEARAWIGIGIGI
jgi:hypothetical protein